MSQEELIERSLSRDSANKTPTQDIFSQFMKLPLDNSSQRQHSMPTPNDIDNNINSTNWPTPILESNADIIPSKIKENGRFIHPLKQKKVSDKPKSLKDFPSNHSTPNLVPSPTLLSSQPLAKLNKSDSDINQIHPQIQQQQQQQQQPQPQPQHNHHHHHHHHRNPTMDLLSDMDDVNDIEHSSSPTIPVDSPSMHTLGNSDEDEDPDLSTATTPHLPSQQQLQHVIPPPSTRFKHQFMVKTNDSYQEPPPTFANSNHPILATKTKSSSSIKKNISFSIATNIADKTQRETYNPSTPQEKAKILRILRDGVKEYSFLLTDFQQSEPVKNRSDHLVDYLRKYGFNLKPKLINDYLGEVKRDKLDDAVKSLIKNNEKFIEDVKYLLSESDKRRKSYNKRRNIKFEVSKKLSPDSNSSSNSSIISTPFVPVSNNENKSILNNVPLVKPTNIMPLIKPNTIKLLPKTDVVIKQDKVKTVIISSVRIGSLINKKSPASPISSTLNTIADLRNIQKKREDERYLFKIRASNSALKKCVEDIYGPNLLFTHSVAYSRIPLAPNHLTSINLETDQMISYVEILLDISKLLYNQNRSTSDLNYSSILQLKSITRIYDNDKLIYRRCDPITGAFTKENNNTAKIILPLQAKLWASLINNYHNGIVDETKFSSLKITHTLFPNDDVLKFKTGANAIHSFVWDFVIDVDNQYSPHCINIVKNPFPSNSPVLQSSYNPSVPSRSKSEIQIGRSSKSNLPTATPTSVPSIPTPQQKYISNHHQAQPQLQQPIQNIRRVTTQTGLSSKHSYHQPQSSQPTLDNTINMNFNFGGSPMSNTDAHMITSTPLATANKYLEMSRGHKRTRSRSMNEIDLMSLPISFDSLLNVPFFEPFSPTDSSTSPIMVKQAVPYLKSQNTGMKNYHQSFINNNNYDPMIGNFNKHQHQSQFPTIMEYKHYNNSDSQLELNNFQHQFDELSNPSPKPTITFSLDSSNTTVSANNNGNNNSTHSQNRNNSTTFKLPMDDLTIYSSANTHAATTIASAPALQTTFQLDDNVGVKELTDLTSLTGIPGINTP